ncbi:MAG: LamG domain-containing protein [Myxococcota bacterium]
MNAYPALALALAACSLSNTPRVACSSDEQCQFAFGADSVCAQSGYCTSRAPGGETGRLDTTDTSVPTVPTTPTDTGTTTEPPTIDLVLYYAFEGSGVTVSDSSGLGHHGTISDLTARTTAGREGRGITLSGAVPAAQFVTLPDGVLTDVDDFTIATWVKLSSIQPWSRVYDFGNGLPDPDNRFMYLTPNGASGIHAASYGGSAANESTLTTGTQLPVGVWKHLALTGHGGERTLYIDGFPAQRLADGPDVPPSEMEPIAPNSWIGKSRFPVDPGLDGTIDDFRIYGRVLTVPELADLARPQHDYSYWAFDESTTDASSNAVPTVLVDGATWTDDGRLGAALDLAGGPGGPSGPHVVMTENPLAACDQAFTILFWVKLRQFDDGARIFDFGTSDDATFVYLSPNDGTGLHFGMASPSGTFDLQTGILFAADDSWHPVAVTMNAANLVVLYVDGVIATTGTSDVLPADLAALDDNMLGRSRVFADPYLDGSIDELRIGCRAFTQDEVRNFSAMP